MRKFDGTIYRGRDLLRPPSLISLSRVLLAGCFPWVVDSPYAAFAVLGLSGVSDVLDGWVARRYGMATAVGALLDPITDKFFVLTVAVTLVFGGYLTVGSVLLLSVREIGELPLVVWFALSPRARVTRADHPKANLPGKLATAMQFATVGWILLRGAKAEILLVATAFAGLLAAASYWHTALRPRRAAPGNNSDRAPSN